MIRPMRTVPPDLQRLTTTLTAILAGQAPSKGHLSVIDRTPILVGSFPKEVVTCRLEDGREIRLFCKYALGYNHNAYGHRRGVAHEASIYRELLEPLQVSAPALYGVFVDKRADEIWLVLEYLDGSLHVSRSPDPAAMGLGAHWIGEFHAAGQKYLQTSKASFLKPYDAEYYLGWAERTLQYSVHSRDRYPWLEPLCERFEEAIDTLLSAPRAVIHGEYYSQNVLFHDGTIYPVDWESAAIAAGEIDLASLTEAWPQEIAHECELQYQAARWPAGPPYDFRRIVCAARLYLHFRWLGESPENTAISWRFDQLHSAGREFGLI